MSRFQIIKRMYCTPIGNYSFVRNISSEKKNEKIRQKTSQKKNKIIDTNELNKESSYSENSYKGLWGFSVKRSKS